MSSLICVIKLFFNEKLKTTKKKYIFDIQYKSKKGHAAPYVPSQFNSIRGYTSSYHY